MKSEDFLSSVNLLVLEKAANEVIESENTISSFRSEVEDLEKKKIKTQEKKQENFYGFEMEISTKEVFVSDPEALRKAIQKKEQIAAEEKKKEKIDAFLSQKAKFETYLSNMGLNPIATLPKHLWKGICKKAGLYRFENIDCYGKTGTTPPLNFLLYFFLALFSFISTGLAYSLFNMGIWGSAAVGILFFCGPFFFLSLYLLFSGLGRKAIKEGFKEKISIFFTSSLSLSWIILTSLISLAPTILKTMENYIMIIMFSFFSVLCLLLSEINFPVLVKVLVRFLPKNAVVKFAFSEMVDSLSEREEERVKIRFAPRPTEHFINVLRLARQNNLSIKIAACLGAIVLNKEEIVNAISGVIKNDPIVYIENQDKDIVFILSSYGEFPKEEKVMKYLEKNKTFSSFLGTN